MTIQNYLWYIAFIEVNFEGNFVRQNNYNFVLILSHNITYSIK